MRILRTIVLFCSMMPRFWATARCAEMEAQWIKEQDALWAAEQDHPVSTGEASFVDSLDEQIAFVERIDEPMGAPIEDME